MTVIDTIVSEEMAKVAKTAKRGTWTRAQMGRYYQRIAGEVRRWNPEVCSKLTKYFLVGKDLDEWAPTIESANDGDVRSRWRLIVLLENLCDEGYTAWGATRQA